MSRLDSFIRRLHAQRACLAAAATLVRDVPGPVLELGLGAGRTYDHLRHLLPGREIFVFERLVAAPPECTPDPRHLILGDVMDTLPQALRRLPGPAVLAHADIGGWDPEDNAALATRIGPHLNGLMGTEGVVVSDQAMAYASWEPLALPPEVAPGRYFMYRVDR
jgi:hypothetical protein